VESLNSAFLGPVDLYGTVDAWNSAHVTLFQVSRNDAWLARLCAGKLLQWTGTGKFPAAATAKQVTGIYKQKGCSPTRVRSNGVTVSITPLSARPESASGACCYLTT